MNAKSLALGPLLFALFLSPAITIQAGDGMSDEQRQQLMEQARKTQECMSRIDQSRLEALAARAETMNKEIKALCAAGKHDQAQNVAIKYGKEISASHEIQEMKKCGEMAKRIMQQIPTMADLEKDYSNGHVCDDM